MPDTEGKALPRQTRHPTKRLRLGEAFSPSRNSLNFLRLVLALAVVVSHATLLGGFGSRDLFHRPTTLGVVAVYGFFGISGFLIANSASRNNLGRYLWQRFLRIFPGFWVCIGMTALFFGVIASITGRHPLHCGLHCYLRGQYGPLSYMYHNFLLWMRQLRISGTPKGVPQPGEWNGSLWSLFFEFLLYLLLGGLAVLGILRRRAAVVLLTVCVWLIAAVRTVGPHVFGNFSVYNLHSTDYNTDISFIAMKILTLTPIFLGGTLIYLYRDRLPDSGLLALGCTVVFVVSLWLPFGGKLPFFSMTSTDLLAPVVAYPLLWLGTHLPFQRIGARNDYSYGVYIYAYPVQQLLATWHVQRWGYLAYLALSVVGVVPFAVASWWIVEKHALKLKKLDLTTRGTSARKSPAPT